jgi:hypothetical protein
MPAIAIFRDFGATFDSLFDGSRFFRLIFAMGKIRGTLCMRSHTSVHRATTKYFSNPFVFKTTIEKEGLPRDSTPALGAHYPTPTGPSPTLTSLCFQQFGESAFRSKLTPMA